MAELDSEPGHRGRRQGGCDDLARPLPDHPERPPARCHRQRSLKGKALGGKIFQADQ